MTEPVTLDDLRIADEVECRHVGCNLTNKDEVEGLTHAATLDDLIQVLEGMGAYKWWVQEDDVLGDPGSYLVLPLDKT